MTIQTHFYVFFKIRFTMTIILDYSFTSSLNNRVKNPTIHSQVLSSIHKTALSSDVREQNTSSIESIQY